MKCCIFFLLILLNVSLNAQNLMPRAGETSDKKINKAELFQMVVPQKPFEKEKFELINFDSLNVSFKSNYPFSVSFGLGINDSGNIAFVGSGGGIYVTDVSDPSNPSIISEIRTRSLVDACTYDPVKKILYVCAYFSGIEIWDLSEITEPKRMSRLPTEPYPRSGAASKDDYLFVTTNSNIMTVDVSNPYNPGVVNQLNLGNGLIIQMLRKDNIIYVVFDAEGLKLVDISDPLNLRLINSFPYISGSRFDISGNYLYAVNSSGSFTILNITDTLNVSVTGSLNIGGYPGDIAVFNNKAYISRMSSDGGMQIIDVQNPASPVSISIFPGDYQFIEGKEDYVFLSRNSSFSTLDVTDSSAVTYISGFELPGFVQDVTASGNYAFTGGNGLRVFDLSDSLKPVEVGYADVAGDLVETADSSLLFYTPFSMTANNVVHVIDISDPANPVIMDEHTCPNMTWDLVVRDSIAYVACWWDGVRLLDFSNPSNIVQISRIMGWKTGAIPGQDYCYSQAADVENNYLYIVDYKPFPDEDTYGLYIIDITDPVNPVLVKRFQGISGYPSDIDVENGKAFISDGSGGVEIVDVSDPVNPSKIGDIRLIDGATGIHIEDKYAYVSDYILGGIQIIDISNPALPEHAGYYKPSGCFAVGVEAEKGSIYVADGVAGFQVYRNLMVPVTSVEKEEVLINDYSLYNYPNPFNPGTTIEYHIPINSYVTLKIYDLLGREVKTLVNEEKLAGSHKIEFNAANLSSGIYFCQIKTGDFIETKKMNLIK